MKTFADMLSEQDMLDVAAYFEAQTPVPKGADPALVTLGQQIYRGGVPGRGVPACIACHGPDGAGNPLAAYPRISSQHAAYTSKQLNAYAAGEIGGDDARTLIASIEAAISTLDSKSHRAAEPGFLDEDPLDHRETLSPDSDELEDIEEEDEESVEDDVGADQEPRGRS